MTANQSTRQATILMEFCQDNLIRHINNSFHQGFPDHTIVEVFVSVCEAVDFMHGLSPPVVHRDLKPENILCTNGRWKLCDFGSATRRVYTLQSPSEVNEASDDIQKNTTSLYRAPEMCDLYRRLPIGTKADVWALGCVLFKLCTFQDAFSEGTNLQILNCSYQ
jgi:AP2-associated kinase